MPWRMFASVSRARCASSSASSSSSARSRTRNPCTRETSTRSPSNMASSFRRKLEHPADYPGHPVPVFRFPGELFTAHRGVWVKLRLAVFLGNAPARGDPFPLLEPHERRIDGSVVRLQNVFADLLNPARNPIPVQRPQDIERLEHHQVESAAQDLALGFHRSSFGNSRGVWRKTFSMSRGVRKFCRWKL